MEFSPRTVMYINGKLRTNVIPLQVNPSSNEELSIVTFNSPQTWEYPSQYISWLVFSIFDSDFQPVAGLTNFRIQLVLSETGQLPSAVQAFESGQPVSNG
jgi:hypothetical protein